MLFRSHQDFSEDTYRTLMAADSAVMVIDGSKGVEAQTIKLFKVCVMIGDRLVDDAADLVVAADALGQDLNCDACFHELPFRGH